MPTFNPELKARGEGDVVPGRLSMTQRLGYAILLNSGVASLQPMTQQERDDLRHVNQLPWPVQINSDSPLPACIADDTVQVQGQDLSIRSLTLSIISAEIYNRDWLTRSVKFALSRAYQDFRGTIPNFSYGTAQVKLSTAKVLLTKEFGNGLTDKDIYQILENDCDNASLAGRYIANTLADQAPKNLEDAIAIAATTYVGGNHASEASRLYVEAVSGAYHLLQPDQAPAADDESAQNEQTFCVGFPRGAGIGTLDSSFTDFVGKNPAALQVDLSAMLWTAEKTPLVYRNDLVSARHQWLADALKRMGFDPAKITLTDIASSNDLDRVLSAPDRCDLSFAKITLNMPATPETPDADSDAPKTASPQPAPAPAASVAPMAPPIKLPPARSPSGRAAQRTPPKKNPAPLPRAPQN